MKLLVFSLLVLLSLLFPDYSRARITQEADNRGTPVAVTPLVPRRPEPRWSYSDFSCISDSIREVIRDDETWKRMWQKMSTAPGCAVVGQLPPAPEIDFTREMLIVATLGERPTTGYGITVDKAYELTDKLEITVRSISSKCGGQAQVVTHPVDVVRVPRTNRAVVFREINVSIDCTRLGPM